MVTLFHWGLPQENPIKHLSPWDEFLWRYRGTGTTTGTDRNYEKKHDYNNEWLILVGGFNHIEKYESQWEGLSHIFGKYILFETNNQNKKKKHTNYHIIY